MIINAFLYLQIVIMTDIVINNFTLCQQWVEREETALVILENQEDLRNR